MAIKKSAASIAKKSKGRPKKEEKTISGDDFEKKAKKKIEELLGSIALTPQEKKQAENKISKENFGGIEWLSEQVNLLTKENEKLKKEVNETKSGENKELSELRNEVISFYLELQTYFNKWGRVEIKEPEFSVKMIKMFPFLERFKKTK